jgi:phosphotransferase system  glucose/maltose/N-acetylglucosamine-specific IIC component
MSNNISATIVKTVQGVGYLSAFILSLVICVPMSMNQEQFKGRCLLFSTGLWQEKDGQFIVNWASQAYCNFTIFVAVIMFVVSVIQFGRFCKFLRRGRDSSFFSAFIDVLLCMLMCIFVLIAACFVTFGFQTWCNEMTRRFETCSKFFKKCGT